MSHRNESNSLDGGFQKTSFFFPLSLAKLISDARLRGLDLMLWLPSHTGRAAESASQNILIEMLTRNAESC